MTLLSFFQQPCKVVIILKSRSVSLWVRARARMGVCVIKMETPLLCWEHCSLSLEMPHRVPERLPGTLTMVALVEREPAWGMNKENVAHLSFLILSGDTLFPSPTLFSWPVILLLVHHAYIYWLHVISDRDMFHALRWVSKWTSMNSLTLHTAHDKILTTKDW